MNAIVQRVRLSLILNVIALVCFNTSARATTPATGTLQTSVLTFAHSPSPAAVYKLTFTVSSSLQSGNSASIVMDFAADGNSGPVVAEPFSNPSIATFTLKYDTNGDGTPDGIIGPDGDGGTRPISFTSAEAQSAAPAKAAATPNVTFRVQRAGNGQYLGILKFPAGSVGLGNNWGLEVKGLPADIRAIAYLDQGSFVKLEPARACASCDSGESCQPPCPSACTSPNFCHGDCPVFPGVRICDVIPCFKVIVVKFPWPPSPDCPMCGREWGIPIRDGFERVVIAFTPLDKETRPIGAGKADQIRVAIKGGDAVGALVDTGDGRYLQAVESRAGEAARMSYTAQGVTSGEIIARPDSEPEREVGPYKALTYVFGALLLAAAAALISLSRQRMGNARA